MRGDSRKLMPVLLECRMPRKRDDSRALSLPRAPSHARAQCPVPKVDLTLLYGQLLYADPPY